MPELVSTLKVLHIITAILMAWPFYALVAVNQRAKLGPPLGDRADEYIESIVKNRATPCLVFQGTVLISGVALIFAEGHNLGVLLTNAALGIKFALLLLIAGTFTYVKAGLQPRIDALFAEASGTIEGDRARRIMGLRRRRKLMATVCLFVVLLSAMLGAQSWAPFPLWLSAALVIVIFLFTWRANRTEIPYGWF